MELSADGGALWEPLGKVTRPATGLNTSTEALGVAPPGTVAAAAPEGLTVRVPAKAGFRSIRILAKGEAASPGGIATDIPLRGSLFRYAAPPIGSPALLDRGGGKEEPLAAGWTPRPGDRLTLLVAPQAVAEGTVVTLENKEGGQVELVNPDGIRKTIARVKQPLRGIGRYAGTERAGAGVLLSWTPTAVLVCTASTARKVDEKEMPVEERGGFVIQPAEPALRGTTHPASQVLIEAVPDGDAKPAVSSFFGLGAPLSTGDTLDPRPTKVEVRIDGGDWEPCPDLRGTLDADDLPRAVQTAVGRNIRDGITHLRVVVGGLGGPGLDRRLKLATVPPADKVQRGRVNISANVMGDDIVYVQFFLNGALVQLTNRAPYTWNWDTLQAANGEHLIEIRGLNDKLVKVTSVLMRVLVDN